MKKKIYTGYAVVNKAMTGCSISDQSLETCKRYCRNGDVIIRTYRKLLGYNLNLYWMKWDKPFSFRFTWNHGNFFWLHLNWSKIYTDQWEKVVFWEPEGKNEE